jgi:UDP-3-O-[3-hydroxymyristoyl] glucosamine N-acyltransferase
VEKKQVLYTLGELAELLDVTLSGRADIGISGLATLKSAGPGQLSFLSNPRYTNQLNDCHASALIIHPDQADKSPCACLISASPYVTYARASQLFTPADPATDAPSIHPTASISKSATLAADVIVGAHAVIEDRVTIGSGSRIGAGTSIGRDVSIGNNSILYANVTVYHQVSIGDNCILHSGVVIGADGFGFAFDGVESIKIAQLGGVRIENDVEIGASSTIDRGALDDTIIEQGVKIDNQVQIGHNCVIGKHTIICGCTCVAGSTTLGSYCMIGGASAFAGHLTIADKVTVSAMAMVTKSLGPGAWSSGTGVMESSLWRKNVVRFSQLNEMSRRLRDLERSTDVKE